MSEKTFRIIKNVSKTIHFGWPMPGLATEADAIPTPHPSDRTKLQGKVLDSSEVAGFGIYIPPGAEFVDENNAFAHIMNDPPSWCGWCVDPKHKELAELKIPNAVRVVDDVIDPDTGAKVPGPGIGKHTSVIGILGANFFLRDVTAERKDSLRMLGGSIPALEEQKKLKNELAEEKAASAAKDAELEELRAKLALSEASKDAKKK